MNFKHLRNAAAIFLFVLLAFPISGFAMGKKPKHESFKVHLTVDFGPAGKPTFSKEMEVEKDSTPKDVVSQAFPIMSGKTCCSFREIKTIDGVKVDPAKNWWWTCLLNGSKKVSPARTKLKPGDRVEWKYIEESQ